MHSLLAVCVLMATAAESLPVSAVDPAWLKAPTDTGNSVIYLYQTKQELFVFGGVPPTVLGRRSTPGATAPRTNTSVPSTDTSVPSTDTSAPSTNTSVPSTDTSMPSNDTSAPSTDNSAPSRDTIVWSTDTSAPSNANSAASTDTSAPSTDTNAPTTDSSVLSTDTSMPSASSNSLFPTSTISPVPGNARDNDTEYTYYPSTGSSYKIHKYQATWDVANATCVSEGARLVVLNDAEEASLVARMLHTPLHNYYSTWTGHRDDGLGEGGTYYGEMYSGVYGWRSDDGATESGAARCVVFSAQQTQLYGFPCDSTWHFTCEISK